MIKAKFVCFILLAPPELEVIKNVVCKKKKLGGKRHRQRAGDSSGVSQLYIYLSC